MKIQRMKDLIAEMREVARGETSASVDAALPSVESAEALVRLLTSVSGDFRYAGLVLQGIRREHPYR